MPSYRISSFKELFGYSSKLLASSIIDIIYGNSINCCGHVLLTEDEGMILGEDDCPCGLKGKYFKIEGRIKNAEIRGCSDTYAAKF